MGGHGRPLDAGGSVRPGLSKDPHDLARFISAQEDVYDHALAELHDGKKRNHWMWFVFPQFAGLGLSPTSQFYAIRSLEEARAYLDHHVLGPRLRDCTEAVLAIEESSVTEIFGFPDDLKFRSCLTLFKRASADESPFERALDRFFDGEPDPMTASLLDGAGASAG